MAFGFFFVLRCGRPWDGAWLERIWKRLASGVADAERLSQRGSSRAWRRFCRRSRTCHDLHLLAAFQKEITQPLFFVGLFVVMTAEWFEAECQEK